MPDHAHANTERLVRIDHQLPGIVGRYVVENEDHVILAEETVLKVQRDQQFKEGLRGILPESPVLDRALNKLGNEFWLAFLNGHFGSGPVG